MLSLNFPIRLLYLPLNQVLNKIHNKKWGRKCQTAGTVSPVGDKCEPIRKKQKDVIRYHFFNAHFMQGHGATCPREGACPYLSASAIDGQGLAWYTDFSSGRRIPER
jgi:hypothetical protein